MDTSQWPQEINLVRSVEEIIPANKASGGASARPEKEKALLNCPRCQSTNTKFCYYNNYSLSQPRYFCKTCRRYWTQGGSLRNIPMGGGSRKNRRPTAMASYSSKKQLSSGMTPPSTYSSNTQLERRHDLNLAFPEINTHQADDFRTMSEFVQIPINGAAIENNIKYKQYHQMTSRPSSLSPTSNRSCFPADPEGPELFSGLNYSLIPILPPPVSDPNTSSGLTFSFPEYKPSFCFSLDHGVGSSGSGVHGKSSGSASSSFRFEDLKHISSTTNVDDDPNKAGGDHSSSSTAGYWTGMLGGGSW